MDIIQVRPGKNKHLLGSFLSENDYKNIIESETKAIKENGEILFLYLKNSLNEEQRKNYYNNLIGKIRKTNSRSVASGQKTRKTNKTTRTPEYVYSSIFGFLERTVREPFCRKATLNRDNPEILNKCLPTILKINDLYKTHLPEKYGIQKKAAEKTKNEYMIPNTVFTTITLNLNFRTACHVDRGDLRDGMATMLVLTKGVFSGGDLVFPKYETAVRLKDNDLIFFDPHEFHGNTQIKPLTKEYKRFSSVFYFREKMTRCGSMEEELKRAQSGIRTK